MIFDLESKSKKSKKKIKIESRIKIFSDTQGLKKICTSYVSFLRKPLENILYQNEKAIFIKGWRSNSQDKEDPTQLNEKRIPRMVMWWWKISDYNCALGQETTFQSKEMKDSERRLQEKMEQRKKKKKTRKGGYVIIWTEMKFIIHLKVWQKELK